MEELEEMNEQIQDLTFDLKGIDEEFKSWFSKYLTFKDDADTLDNFERIA